MGTGWGGGKGGGAGTQGGGEGEKAVWGKCFTVLAQVPRLGPVQGTEAVASYPCIADLSALRLQRTSLRL